LVDRESFVKTVVLRDAKARALNTRNWSKKQRKDPQAQYDEFKAWNFDVWTQLVRLKLKGLKKRKNLKKHIKNGSSKASSVDVQLRPADMIVVQRPPVSSQISQQITPVQNAGAEPLPKLALMSLQKRLSLHTKRSSESVDLPESADNKRRRIALSFFPFMADLVREGAITTDEIVRFCTQIDNSETQEMDGLKYDTDARDYLEDISAEEEEVSDDEDEMPQDLPLTTDMNNGVRHSVSLAPN
jgi:hypothetical protein